MTGRSGAYYYCGVFAEGVWWRLPGAIVGLRGRGVGRDGVLASWCVARVNLGDPANPEWPGYRYELAPGCVVPLEERVLRGGVLPTRRGARW